MQQVLMQFDQQYNFTMEMVKNYEYYQMQVRHSDLLLLRSMDQLESITDENDRTRLSQKMTELSNKARTADRSQLWIRTIIKRHAQTLRNNLERYYVLRIVQQSLLALDEIIDLYQDVIYQHQFFNGKIISLPQYQILECMTVTEELSTTMPSKTSEDITTSSTPVVATTQLTTQVTLHISTKEGMVDTSSEEQTNVTTALISTTVQPDIY